MMNARIPIAALLLLGTPLLAQDAKQAEDPIEAAIRAFNSRDKSEPNEITVVLPPPEKTKDDTPKEPEATNAGPPAENQNENKPDAAAPGTDRPSTPAEAEKPVLVTGKPPAGSQLIDITDVPIVPGDAPPAENEPTKGLEVHVQNLQSGDGKVDTSKVKLLAPFPAKPLSKAPAGWRLETSKDAPPFQHQVELSPGRKITLSIHPHLLVPDANGSDQFAVAEPGFNASLGYGQSDTVGACLNESIQQLETDSKKLGAAIDQLQQILASLPANEKAPAKDPHAPKPKIP